jgi:hypothetical protein
MHSVNKWFTPALTVARRKTVSLLYRYGAELKINMDGINEIFLKGIVYLIFRLFPITLSPKT